MNKQQRWDWEMLREKVQQFFNEPISKRDTPARYTLVDRIADASKTVGCTLIALSIMGGWISDAAGSNVNAFFGVTLGTGLLVLGLVLHCLVAKMDAKQVTMPVSPDQEVQS